eukprot:NODE_1094_length_1016_cov_80.323960_g1049_i0.p1 GENE.NODE_1094_length_1016_cov_80.323960_g1049_i0~~NODE_1094_length_1016_cov_80.323960_g1049_i0.p1  ORF type:complete len:255 (-),score=66.67 NODE_1094_length_1016_cov_80.323960_g1049_i0:139-903(-)
MGCGASKDNQVAATTQPEKPGDANANAAATSPAAGEKPVVVAVRVTYKVKPDCVDNNKANIKTAVAGARALNRDDLAYSVWNWDTVNFMHVAWFADAAAQEALTSTEGFKTFSSELKEKYVDGEVDFQPLSFVGSAFNMFKGSGKANPEEQKAMRISYTIKPEFIDTNKANIAKVMTELRKAGNPNCNYCSFQLANDTNSFMHFSYHPDEETGKLVTDLPAFGDFRNALKESGPTSPPKPEELQLVAAAHDLHV